MTLSKPRALYRNARHRAILREVLAGTALAALLLSPGVSAKAAEAGWGAYGGDEGGMRFSPAAQITPANVAHLKQAWTYSTGDMTSHKDAMHKASFEATPILAGGRLYLCSPFDEVSALDPGTGKQIWRFDPKLDTKIHYPNDYVCRGVTYWRDGKRPAKAVCAAQIFVATNDRRLIALDAKDGKPCPGFGDHGTLGIKAEGVLHYKGGMQITSAPVVSHGVIVTGSSIDDNQYVEETHGTVHAYDAETGALKWTFDPIARSDSAPNASSWASAEAKKAGAANVWAPMSVDEARGLVFLPTTSPSPDFFGGLRPGDNRYANSVVALHIETGAMAWSFQTTHHDVWDYDIPAQPTLAAIPYHGNSVDAVLQPTKQGLLFTLDRDTGKPVIPVVERKVPQGGAPGEHLSPAQPFPVAPAPLAKSTITPGEAWGLTFYDRGKCRALIAKYRHEGLYTPPSLRGTIEYPFTGGGTNWGGLAYDPKTGMAYVNTSNLMHLIKLIPAAKVEGEQERLHDTEVSPQNGAPFGMLREVIRSPLGLPCNPPPWGQLHAIDMHTGRIVWSVPLGTTGDMAPMSEYFLGTVGVPNMGGPMVTEGGLVFIGAAMDDYIRAFDAKSGKELWKARLPAGGQATPMSYVWHGKQYVLIAAGGHSKLGTKRGDQLVAFALE